MIIGAVVVMQLVATDTRDPRIESSHGKFYFLSNVLYKLYRKDENIEKEAGYGPIFVKMST